MKTNLKNILGLAVLGMTLLATTVLTWAGKVDTPGVTIGSDGTSQFAHGSLVGTRYSRDSKQTIGCQITSYALNSTPYVGCSAHDSTGRFLSCFSYEPRYVEAVQGMTDSAELLFRAGSTGFCSQIIMYHGSDKLR